MMKRIIALLGILSGCASFPAAPANVSSSPDIRQTLHGDTRWTEGERIIWEDAAARTWAFTNGNVQLRIVWDLDERSLMDLADEPRILRVPATYCVDNRAGKVTDATIRLAPDCCPHDLEACAMHELGHFIGLVHVDDEHSVMSARNPAHRFSSADREMCASVGRCRRRDVTTVTMTEDRSIPKVEPDYP